MLSIYSLQVTNLATNCYIIVHNQSKKSLIVDPGGDSHQINSLLEDLQSQPLAILATHAHFDHIMAVSKLKTKYRIPFYLHHQDHETLHNASLLSEKFISQGFQPPTVDQYLQSNELSTHEIEPFTFQYFLTPGHTPGSICLEFNHYQNQSPTHPSNSSHNQNNKVNSIALLTGDTLFANNQVGRTDLPGGNFQQLQHSLLAIKQRLKSINTKQNKIRIFPGHGPAFLHI